MVANHSMICVIIILYDCNVTSKCYMISDLSNSNTHSVTRSHSSHWKSLLPRSQGIFYEQNLTNF
jgi:hypothetical protein